MKAVVYSKSACGFCIRVKKVLEKNGIEIDEKLYGDEVTQDDIKDAIGAEFRTFPQVLIDNKYVGGYSEVCNYFGIKAR